MLSVPRSPSWNEGSRHDSEGPKGPLTWTASGMLSAGLLRRVDGQSRPCPRGRHRRERRGRLFWPWVPVCGARWPRMEMRSRVARARHSAAANRHLVYLTGSVLGGRPRRGNSPTFCGRRPARKRALRKRTSMCALVLRSSSDAQRARASWTAGSTRMSRLLLSGIVSGLSGTRNRGAQTGVLVLFVLAT